MHPEFWHTRWQDGRIGFHQDRPTPLMLAHWSSLGLPVGSRVLVPLCGKSLDMAWLASQRHRVLGVELSPLAVEQFYAENGLAPEARDTPYGRHYAANGIEIVCGDAFELPSDLLASCDAVYDRAALIALPTEMRRRYADAVYARLASGTHGLLVTLEYPQHEKAGPPFSVDAREVDALFSNGWRVRTLDRRDILGDQPAFAAEGVTALHTAAYRLDRR